MPGACGLMPPGNTTTRPTLTVHTHHIINPITTSKWWAHGEFLLLLIMFSNICYSMAAAGDMMLQDASFANS